MTQQLLGSVVRRIWRREETLAAFDVPGRWYELSVTPSCPPDKRLQIRGGTVTASPYWLWVMNNDFVPDMVCDFENEEETGLALSFSSAEHYLPIILCYYYYWIQYRTVGADEPPYFDCVVGTEVATSIEAEAQIDAWLNGYTQWYKETLPLWGVVFKNDGVVGIPSSILPIDSVNRGRSYLYRDARMRHNISG